METAEVVDGEVEQHTEVVPHQAAETLFRTDDPMEIMRKTSEIATSLRQFVKDQGLVARISNRDYIVVEGWQMLGMMLGVLPVVSRTTAIEHGWEAVVELRDRTGRVVGSGEAECLETESAWKTRDDYARRSMAQTRAVGKAFRNTFGFIAKAAGFEATPAEEMPSDGTAIEHGRADDNTGKRASEKQVKLIRGRAAAKPMANSTLVGAVCHVTGFPVPQNLTSQDDAHRWLEEMLPTMPSRRVDAVLALIEKASAEA